MNSRKPAKKVEEVHALSAIPVTSITWVLVTRIEEKEEVTSHLIIIFVKCKDTHPWQVR